MTLSPRKRVQMALNHQETDRPPINYVGTPEANAMLCSYLGLPDSVELMRHLGVDLWPIMPRFIGPSPKVGMVSIYGAGEDIWGVVRRPVANEFGVYYEVVHQPLADAHSVAEVDAHPWPRLDWFDWDSIRRQIEEICQRDDYYITIFCGSPFEDAQMMCGVERFLTMLALKPELACRMLDHITTFMCDYMEQAIIAGQGRIDMIRLSDDIAGQRGLLVSPQTWRQWLRPQLKRLVDLGHHLGVTVRYHSDGAVWPLLDDLVAVGIDVLNPLQFGAGIMTPEELKARYGSALTFDGGIDTQHILPHGNVQEVVAHVRERIRVLGSGGGYIVNTCHNVQPDVPAANVAAAYHTARTWTYGSDSEFHR